MLLSTADRFRSRYNRPQPPVVNWAVICRADERNPVHSPENLRWPDTIAALMLTLASGYIDAIGFLRLGGIYVANMSGNSVALGMHSAEKDWPVVLFRILPLACFVCSLLCTRLSIDLGAPLLSNRVAAPPLFVEAVFLVFFAESRSVNTGIFFAATAMGIHAGTLNRFNGITVHTAFVTGTLVKFAESLAASLIACVRRTGARQDSQAAIWFAGLWCAYVAGAIAGLLLLGVHGPRAAMIACVPLLAVALMDVTKLLTISA